MPDIPRNWTPTFRLTSIEKPDMSPYLFHMTTKESLKSILEDQETEKEQGRLLAQKPRKCNNNYNISMVCFTETPPFALDFFRYRWSEDKDRVNLKYGIGFDKQAMVKKGVFPTFYVDDKLQAQILGLTQNNRLEKLLQDLDHYFEEDFKEIKKILINCNDALSSVKRLMFPLLENKELQGYIWEREWRYVSDDQADFIFSYEDIRIICCTDEDESKFRTIIRETFINNNPIQFIKTWKEYNEITDFINHRTKSNSNINKKIQEVLAERKSIDHHLYYLENQESNIHQLKKLRDDLNEEIKKIALIKLFENISGCNPIRQKLKRAIMANRSEVIIVSIASYYQNKKYTLSHQQTPDNNKQNPQGFLLRAIEEGWQPRGENPEEEIAEIKRLMDTVIKEQLEVEL